MNNAREAVANTGLLVAAIRAMESTRDDRLFTDPFADRLAGDTGRRLLAAAMADSGEASTVQIVVRTRFWDEALLRAVRVAKQVVIVAAGMDARAYRLAWPDGTTVYELDQPAVIAAKAEILADDPPQCRRRCRWGRPGDDRPTRRAGTRFRSSRPRRSGSWRAYFSTSTRALCAHCSTAFIRCRVQIRPWAVRGRRHDAAGSHR